MIALLALAAAAAAFAAGEAAAADGTVGSGSSFAAAMLENFTAQMLNFENAVSAAASQLFHLLFLCQFTWSVIQLFLHENLTFGAVVTTIIRQGMTGMFFYWLLLDRTVLKTIVASFQQLGGGAESFQFTALFRTAEETVGKLLAAASRLGGWTSLGVLIVGLSAGLVMSFALTSAIGYMVIVTLENYIAGTVGMILLGFGGSDYTRSYTAGYIRALVCIGFKLFLVSVIIQVGVASFQATIGDLSKITSGDSFCQICMNLIAQSFFFLAIVKIIPDVTNLLLNGAGGMMGGGGVASSLMAAAGMVTSMGKMAYNAPGGAVDGVKAGVSGAGNVARQAASVYKTSAEASKAKGRGGMNTAVRGAGSVLWAGYQATRAHGPRESPNSMTPVDPSIKSKNTAPSSAPAGEKSEKEAGNGAREESSGAAGAVSPPVSYSAPSPEELAKKGIKSLD
jgi:type IV secretion system protein TrbL